MTPAQPCFEAVSRAPAKAAKLTPGCTPTARRVVVVIPSPDPAPPPRCAGQRQFAVITAGAGSWANVELGGCWRTQRPYPDHSIGTADARVLTAILHRR